MNQLYPLKFKPIYKDKIWGGDKIRTILGKDFSPLPNCGEVWVVSGVEGFQTTVGNGFLADNEINEIIEIYMDELVGEKVFDKHGDEFPLLIKFIDAKDWLSIQVHPDDDLAHKRKIGNGKSEMWYIIGSDEGSQLISGFKQKVKQAEYLKHLENNTLSSILNYETAKPGDVFFMPAGRVHALGPGILLAEIQQTSDTTYRMYDWDRTDEQGQGRELHTQEALEAIDFNIPDENKTPYKETENGTAPLVSCPYFTTNLITLAQSLRKDYSELDSFVLYICVEGASDLVYHHGDILQLNLGEAILIPASMQEIIINPKENTKILEVYIQ